MNPPSRITSKHHEAGLSFPGTFDAPSSSQVLISMVLERLRADIFVQIFSCRYFRADISVQIFPCRYFRADISVRAFMNVGRESEDCKPAFAILAECCTWGITPRFQNALRAASCASYSRIFPGTSKSRWRRKIQGRHGLGHGLLVVP